MGRAPCCDKANVKRGPWSPEEDAKLKSYIEQHGTGGNWIALPQKIGLKRCGKSCRLRWLNYLRPNIRHGGFSEEEDNIICSLYVSIGSRWSVIAAQLPGRTDNDIKNYWNTRLKKKLLGKQRKQQEAAGRNYKQKQAESGTTTRMHMLVQNTSQQQPYSNNWPPHMPLVFSNYSSSNHQDPSFNDQDSLRTLLLKLGGRFSHSHSDHVYRPSLDIPVMGTDGQLIIPQVPVPPQQIYEDQQLHNNAGHWASSSSSSSSGCIISSINNNNIINHDGNQVEMGLDGVEELLYGEDEDIMVNIEKIMIGIGGPPTSTSMNWCDSSITTSIYPHQQQCAFQDHLSYNNGA